MPIYHQGRKVKEVFYQGRRVKEVWHLGRRIYSSKPVEVIPAGGYAAVWLRDTLQKYRLNYRTVTQLPFDLDTSRVTDMSSMFDGCSSLTTVPQMDTRNVTRMPYMFYGCSSLTTVPTLDTRNVTDMSSMFDGCRSLTTVPQMDTRNVTDMSSMFYGCRSLTDGNVALTVKRRNAETYNMIASSGLTREPFITIE